ncbi:MAG: hypothetical protein IJJ33_05770 [Victivallales bacterium]|nr:hypothetical protein [Victivallales bacterium]
MPAVVHIPPSEDCGAQFKAALAELSRSAGEKILRLAPGRYVFRKKDSTCLRLPVSNTVTRQDCQVKHVALLIDRLESLAVEGNGAELLMDGDVSAIVLTGCRNVRLERFSIDYLHPRVSEMTVLAVAGCSADFRVHPSSRWTSDARGRFCWLNPDGAPEVFDSPQVVQCANPGNTSNLRALFNPVRQALRWEEAGTGFLRFCYPEPPPLRVGETWQFRDPSRRENGIVLNECAEIDLTGLELRFTPGLGVVAQMSRNLRILHHRHVPANGRVCAAFADGVQVSSCYGRLEIADSLFSGLQDDPVNVHGIYLAVQRAEGRRLWLQFRQPETWGWLPYRPGDEVCLVRRDTLARLQSFHVRQAKLLDDTSVLLELDSVPKFPPEELVLENMSSYPQVLIHDCLFERYPTRGILMSSAAKCVIRGNVFRQTARRPAILVAGDADSWYESGGVRDLTITGNRFCLCPVAAVEINPRLQTPSGDVHQNVTIDGNRFEQCSPIRLRHHAVKKLQTDLPPENVEKISVR